MKEVKRRVRLTTPVTLPKGVTLSDGHRAAYWRERIAKLSRPALAQKLGTTSTRIARLEGRHRLPAEYRLACAAIAAGLERFNWTMKDAPTANPYSAAIAKAAADKQ